MLLLAAAVDLEQDVIVLKLQAGNLHDVSGLDRRAGVGQLLPHFFFVDLALRVYFQGFLFFLGRRERLQHGGVFVSQLAKDGQAILSRQPLGGGPRRKRQRSQENRTHQEGKTGSELEPPPHGTYYCNSLASAGETPIWRVRASQKVASKTTPVVTTLPSGP